MRPESAAGIESGVASLPRGLNELRKTIAARVGGDGIVLAPDGVHKALERIHWNLLTHSVNHRGRLASPVALRRPSDRAISLPQMCNSVRADRSQTLVVGEPEKKLQLMWASAIPPTSLSSKHGRVGYAVRQRLLAQRAEARRPRPGALCAAPGDG